VLLLNIICQQTVHLNNKLLDLLDKETDLSKIQELENTIKEENEEICSQYERVIEMAENLDKEYKDYYTEELVTIKIHCIYINKNNEIERVIEDKMILKTPGLLSKEEIVSIIKHGSICNQVKYSLLYILKYNINLEPIYLKTFLRNKALLKDIGSPFLQSVKNIDTIKFDKCISMFHDLNDLFIIFYDKDKGKLTNSSELDVSNNRTKKIYINSSSFKKTKRNIFKDNTP
jgi:hypothetical protein